VAVTYILNEGNVGVSQLKWPYIDGNLVILPINGVIGKHVLWWIQRKLSSTILKLAKGKRIGPMRRSDIELLWQKDRILSKHSTLLKLHELAGKS
tara:strand:- start:1026 stop:1310 length:285 start_codon:yes stop_codon:yes gene_type:complete